MSAGRNQGFLANLFVLASGSTFAQIITLAILPIITRLYDPNAFGVLSIFIALSAVLINMSSFQFSEVIVICDAPEDADRAAVISTILVVLVSCLAGVVVWMYADGLGELFGISESSFLLGFLSFAVLFGGMRIVCRRWLLRERNTRMIATSEVMMAIADRISTVALGVFTAGSPLGLVVGRVVGLSVGFFAAVQIRNNRLFGFRFSRDQLAKMGALARRYKRFPYYSWAKLLEIMSNQLPVLLIGAFFGPAVAGGYALSRRVLAEPAVLLGSAVAQSYFQYAARQKDESAVGRATAQLVSTLVKLVSLPIFIGLTCAPELIPLLFGDKWENTGWYTFILTPMFMVYFVMRPLNRIFSLKEKQREKGIFAAQNILVIVIALWLTAQFGNEYIALAVFSLASSVYLSYRGIWLMRLVGADVAGIGRSLSFGFLVTALAVSCSLYLRVFLGYSDIALIASSVGLTLVYLLLVVARDKEIVRIVGSIVKKF